MGLGHFWVREAFGGSRTKVCGAGRLQNWGQKCRVQGMNRQQDGVGEAASVPGHIQDPHQQGDSKGVAEAKAQAKARQGKQAPRGASNSKHERSI